MHARNNDNRYRYDFLVFLRHFRGKIPVNFRHWPGGKCFDLNLHNVRKSLVDVGWELNLTDNALLSWQ